MQKLSVFGVSLVAPTLIFAHDGGHQTTVWYQEPIVVGGAVVALLAMVALCYGLKSKRNVVTAVSLIILAIMASGGLALMDTYSAQSNTQLVAANLGEGKDVTLYKSPNCGCCSGHAKALEEAGFTVTIEETDDLDGVKVAHSIPTGGESCHTSVIGDYVVEGHVPLEAIEKLLTERPDAAGIGLAGMPIGTPGMPGKKTAPYEVYQLSTSGEMSPYLTI